MMANALDLSSAPSTSANHTHMEQYTAQQIQEAFRIKAQMMAAAGEENLLNAEKLTSTPISSANESMFNKFRLNNDVIDGFIRFEAPTSCGDEECSYSGKVSHFHCTKEGCSYKFTGRTHMYKHQQHHERFVANAFD